MRSRIRIHCLRRTRVTILTTLGAIILAPPVQAENSILGAELGVSSGLEGGDGGTDVTTWRRAKTRIRAGAELRYNEVVPAGVAFLGFAEIEGRPSAGAEIQYRRWVTERVGVHAGIIGVVAPETLVGASAGASAVLPFGGRFGAFVEPSFAVLPFGSDLPDDSVLLWVLIAGGVCVAL